jgi:hypothetical protein
MTMDEAGRQRAARDALLEAAGGVGPYRLGAYPLAMECPFRDWVAVDPWDAAGYALRMIVHDHRVAWAAMSEPDQAAVREVMATRVREVEAERERAATRKRRPAVRDRTWED